MCSLVVWLWLSCSAVLDCLIRLLVEGLVLGCWAAGVSSLHILPLDCECS